MKEISEFKRSVTSYNKSTVKYVPPRNRMGTAIWLKEGNGRIYINKIDLRCYIKIQWRYKCALIFLAKEYRRNIIIKTNVQVDNEFAESIYATLSKKLETEDGSNVKDKPSHIIKVYI